MAILVDHQPVNLATGTHTFGPFTVVGGGLVNVRLARCTTATPSFWPNVATGVALSVENSPDSGATWLGMAGFTSNGGILIGRGGAEVPETTMRCPLPPSATRLRAIIVVTSGPLVSQVTLETA